MAAAEEILTKQKRCVKCLVEIQLALFVTNQQSQEIVRDYLSVSSSTYRHADVNCLSTVAVVVIKTDMKQKWNVKTCVDKSSVRYATVCQKKDLAKLIWVDGTLMPLNANVKYFNTEDVVVI